MSTDPTLLFADLDDPQPLADATNELRGAVRARADHRRRVRRFTLAVPSSLLATGLVAMLAVVGLPGRHAPSIAPAPLPTSSEISSPTATAGPELAFGQVASREEVPWPLVGPGWFLVTVKESGHDLLFLTNAHGGSYRIADLPRPDGVGLTLADISADGGRALLIGATTSTAPGYSLWDIDLRSGQIRTEHVADQIARARYASPTGADVILSIEPSLGTPTYPVNDAGQLLERLTFGSTPHVFADGLLRGAGAWLPVEDSSSFVLATAKGLRLIDAAGTPIRALAGSGRCTPVRWWSSGTFIASCAAHPGTPTRLWVVPLSGAAAQPLTGQRPEAYQGDSRLQDLGDRDAWQLSAGLFVNGTATDGLCAVEFVLRANPSGTDGAINAPHDVGQSLHVLGADATRLAVLSSAHCGGPSSLEWLDPQAGTIDRVMVGPIGSALAW